MKSGRPGFHCQTWVRLPADVSIPEFVGRFENVADCVLFNWVFFGPNGHKTPPASDVLSSFTRRQAAIHPFTKYLARSSCLTGPKLSDPSLGHGFWHCPAEKVDQPMRVINVLGEDMSNYYQDFPSRPSNFVNDPIRKEHLLSTAIIHHYAFRSEQAFAERARRGLKGAFSGQSVWRDLSESEKFEGFLSSVNEVEDTRLATFWDSYVRTRAESTNVLAPSDPSLVSYRKKALQSSLSPWSTGATPGEDASGAVNGVIDGTHKFHTSIEDAPWWMVDLGKNFGITRVEIYNRIDQEGVAQRASRLKIEIGLDADHLAEFFRKDDDKIFGGADGNPLVWKTDFPVLGRFVRIRLLTRNFFHLDQVKIYGNELDVAIGLAPVS